VSSKKPGFLDLSSGAERLLILIGKNAHKSKDAWVLFASNRLAAHACTLEANSTQVCANQCMENGSLRSFRDLLTVPLHKLLESRNVISFEQAERGGDDPMLQRRVVRRAERISHRERDEQRPRRLDQRSHFPQQGN
jgi:hypothetical protein